MAQDYSINLKATLDTTQVKQQIAQLRNQTQSIMQQTAGGKQSQVGAFPSLQNLQATLSRLNTTLMQLQTAIRQMATSIRGQTQTLRAQLTPNRFNQPAVNTRNSLSPALAGKPPLLRMFKEEYEKTINSNASKEEITKAWDKKKREWDIKDRIAKAKFNRRLGYLIGGQLLGGAGDLATSAGYNTLGTSLNIAGQSVTAGAGTAFAVSQIGLPGAGFAGALVGGATAVASAFSKLKEHTEALGQTIYAITLKNQTLISDFRSSLNANEIAWKSSRNQEFYNELPLDILKRRQNSMYGSYIENLDKRDTLEKYYREQLSKIEANRDAQLKPLYARSTQLASNNSIQGAGRRILEQQNLAEQIKLIQESANTQLEAVKNSYTNDLKNINESIADYENLLKAIDNVSNKEKERIKLQEQEALRLTELKAAHEAYLKSLNDSISKFKGEFNQAATEQNATIFTQDILTNKSMSAKDKFKAISERLDAAYDSRNAAQLGVYSAVNELDRFSKSLYMTADVGNLPFAGFMRQMAVQNLSKNIADSQLGLANQNSIVNIFENALKSITQKLVAPDMSHVTSISQYGYGMGEVDNADQRMENYLSKQTNLQEQINEKLRQGIKTLPLYVD